MTKSCYPVNIPVVDNSECQCLEYTDWACTIIPDGISYLSVVDGESLESAFTKLVAILVAKSAAISAINAREASYVTLSGTQTITNKTFTAPTLTKVAFASLPATPVEGMLAVVTDSTVTTWGATIVGGNSNHVLAYFNGTNWIVK